MNARLSVEPRKIAEFCRRHNIRKLALFGSVLRDDFRPESDVDVLVEFEPGRVPGFIRLYEIEQQLSRIMGGHPIDFVTEKALFPHLRERILSEAEVQYAQG